MKSLAAWVGQLRQAGAQPPPTAGVLEAAQRACARSNVRFAKAGLPVRAIATQKQHGVTMKLRRTGTIRGRIVGPGAQDVLREELHREIPAMRRALTAELHRRLK